MAWRNGDRGANTHGCGIGHRSEIGRHRLEQVPDSVSALYVELQRLLGGNILPAADLANGAEGLLKDSEAGLGFLVLPAEVGLGPRGFDEPLRHGLEFVQA